MEELRHDSNVLTHVAAAMHHSLSNLLTEVKGLPDHLEDTAQALALP